MIAESFPKVTYIHRCFQGRKMSMVDWESPVYSKWQVIWVIALGREKSKGAREHLSGISSFGFHMALPSINSLSPRLPIFLDLFPFTSLPAIAPSQMALLRSDAWAGDRKGQEKRSAFT